MIALPDSALLCLKPPIQGWVNSKAASAITTLSNQGYMEEEGRLVLIMKQMILLLVLVAQTGDSPHSSLSSILSFFYFSIVHSLLDEIVNSAVHRCVNPVLMEPSVSTYQACTKPIHILWDYFTFWHFGKIARTNYSSECPACLCVVSSGNNINSLISCHDLRFEASVIHFYGCFF